MPSDRASLTQHAGQLLQTIGHIAQRYQGSADAVALLAVSKGRPISAIQEVFNAGIHNFGESYLQEALPKIYALNALPLCWHFIGPLQSNKTKSIATHFHWVHSIDREKTAVLLDTHRPAHLGPLNVCLQVNLDNENNKSGLNPSQVEQLAYTITQLPQLKLRGLMTIPMPQCGEERQYESFLRLTSLFNQLNKTRALSMDTLSMGMSNDWVAAIRAGSTLVRIGRALFENK